jgi:hypothetical protein
MAHPDDAIFPASTTFTMSSFLSGTGTVERNTPPAAEHMARMETFIEESMTAGVLLATEGCLPSARGPRAAHG